jgi:DNA-binding transcriptional MerR regulator
MRNYQAQTFSIGNVAKLTGASKKQIRNVGKRKDTFPRRIVFKYGDRAYRRFSLKQVELISKIKNLA